MRQNSIAVIVMVVMTLIVFFPAFYPSRYHSVDAITHIYLTALYGEHIKSNLLPPDVLEPISHPDSPQLGYNNTYPIYYGHALYTLAGYFGLVFGPYYGLYIVLMIFALFALWSVYFLVQRVTERGNFVSVMVSLFSVFSIYNMQNLYFRGALTEYFATICVLTALSQALSIYFALNKEHLKLFFSCMFFCAVAINTHPITMYVSWTCFLFVAIVVVPKFFSAPTGIALILKFVSGVFLLILSILHFICAYLLTAPLMKSYPTGLSILGHLDRWYTRLFPLPADFRIKFWEPISSIGTPFLDAQICLYILGLILFCGFVIYKKMNLMVINSNIKKNMILGLTATALAVLYLVFSLNYPVFLVNLLFAKIQFLYRLVFYVNVFLLFGLVFFLAILYGNGKTIKAHMDGFKNLLWLLTGFFLSSLLVIGVQFIIDSKGTPSTFTADFSHKTKEAILNFYSPYWYGSPGYSRNGDPLPIEFQGLPGQDIKFPPQLFKNVQRPKYETTVNIKRRSVCTIHIYPHDWNNLIVINKATDVSTINPRQYEHSWYVTVLEPGTYTIQASFDPPLIWTLLRYIHYAAMVTLFGLWIWHIFRELTPDRKSFDLARS